MADHLAHGLVVDHIDRDKLNCQRANLRMLTLRQSNQNRGPRAGSRSGLRGVNWSESDQRWRAIVTLQAEPIASGCLTIRLPPIRWCLHIDARPCRTAMSRQGDTPLNLCNGSAHAP